MSTIYNYDEYDFKNNNIQNVIFKINNIKLLENPEKILYNDNDITLIKIICNKSIKIFLKNIEKYLQNPININFDIEKGLDFFELKLNKYIEQINNTLNPNEFYNLELSINTKNELWKIHSIEISNCIFNNIQKEDLDLLEIDCDFSDIVDNLLNQIKRKKNKLNKLQLKLDNLFFRISKNFNIEEINNYENELNLIN